MNEQVLHVRDSGELWELAGKGRHGNFLVNYRGWWVIRTHDLAVLALELRDLVEQGFYPLPQGDPNPLILDGGAHLGVFSLLVRRRFPSCRLVAFEPDPVARALLEENLRRNGCGDVSVVPWALGEEDGEASFTPGNGGDAGSLRDAREGITVGVRSLQPWVGEAVTMLKLNVEGAEEGVLRGLGPMIRNIRQISLEFHHFPEWEPSLGRVIGLLERRGFRVAVGDLDARSNPALHGACDWDHRTRYFQLITGRRLEPWQSWYPRGLVPELIRSLDWFVLAGRGSHTRNLLHEYPDLKDHVRAICSPDLTCREEGPEGIMLVPEDDPLLLEAPAILISSHSFEKEIFRRLVQVRNIPQEKLFRLYTREPQPVTEKQRRQWRNWLGGNGAHKSNLVREKAWVLGRTTVATTPRVLEIELTNRCPMSCIMCPRSQSMTRPLGDMDLSLYENLLDQMDPEAQKDHALDLPVLYLYHYGESLVHPRLAEAISMAASRGYWLSLSCNPGLMRPEMAESLIQAGLDDIVFMVDGVSNEVLSSIRGPLATWDRVQEGISCFLQKRDEMGSLRPRVRVTQVPLPQNLHEADRFKNHFRQRRGIADAHIGVFSAFNQSIPEINALQQMLLETNSWQKEQWHARRRERASLRCFYPWHSVVVLWDGRVVPCCRDYNGLMVLGDLKEQSLMEVWNGHLARDLREKVARGDYQNPLCNTCQEANWDLERLGRHVRMTRGDWELLRKTGVVRDEG